MEVEVVSYWPVPLLDLHKNDNKPTLLLIEEKIVELQDTFVVELSLSPQSTEIDIQKLQKR